MARVGRGRIELMVDTTWQGGAVQGRVCFLGTPDFECCYYRWLTSLDKGLYSLGLGRMALTGLQRVEQRAGLCRGRGNTHREVHLPHLGNPVTCVHMSVAV